MSINTTVGSPGVVDGASGGLNYAFSNISTVPQIVLPIAAQRIFITFHNPGTVDIFVAPLTVQGTGTDVTLVPSPSSLGGCWRVFANGGTLTFYGECQKSWQAFSASGSNNPLTIRVSRIS